MIDSLNLAIWLVGLAACSFTAAVALRLALAALAGLVLNGSLPSRDSDPCR